MLECWGDFGSRFAVLGGGGAGRLGGGRWGRLVRGFRVPDPGFRFAVRGSRFSVLGSRCEALGVRECWSFGCWNARIRVDFLALVDPQAFQAWFGLWVAVARVGRARSSRPTSRFASLISLRRDRETSLCSVTPLAYSDVVSGKENHHRVRREGRECRSLDWIFGVVQVRFANVLTRSLKVLPTQTLGRTAVRSLSS
jgi:hypothetical protein